MPLLSRVGVRATRRPPEPPAARPTLHRGGRGGKRGGNSSVVRGSAGLATLVLKPHTAGMSAEHRADFFHGIHEHSQIKLRALARYLPPWSAKVGSPRSVRRVWVVDGFAGPGVYESGEAGSPRIVLEHAEAIARRGASYQVAAFFVEKQAKLFRGLREECNRHPQVQAIPALGDFWSQTKRVVEFVEDAPVLVFVDPFGLGDLKFEPLVELCGQLRRVDLMVNFASPAAKRLAKDHEALVSSSVGGAGWEADSITQTFCDRLAKACGFLSPAVLPVAAQFRGARRLKYDLVLASRHPAAYVLWNDEIASADGAILDGADQVARQNLLDDARPLLRSAALAATFSRDKLIERICVQECGRFHTRVLRAAVEAMVDDGEWVRDDGKVGTARMWKV